MNKKRKKQLLYSVSALVLLVFLVRFLATGQQRQIKNTISSIETLVEREDVSGCLGWLASNYSDEKGYSIKNIRDILNNVFQSLDDINVTVINQKIMIKENEALVLVTFKVVGTVKSGMRGYVAGNLNQPARLSVHMTKKDSLWLIDRVNQLETLL